MTGYTKLFGSIITSTIWREDKETKILWITMLALKNKHGIVEGSVPGLADMARLSIPETLAALEILRSPDAYSRTKKFEGRRIEDIEGGWLVLNHEMWRNKMNADERREYLRVKQQEHRARVNKPVNKRKRLSTPSTHTDADAYTDKEKKGANGSRPTSDLDWLASLCKDETYRGIDVRREHGKMTAWCKTNRKEPTRRRFINWLNRVDRPMTLAKPTAPVYGRNRLGPQNDLTESELDAQRKIVREASEKLKAEFNR